jgi:hypothetical protein
MRRIFLSLLVVVFSVAAQAQKNEVAFTAGGYFAVSNPLNPGTATALEGSFAHQIAHVPLISLSLELPVAGSFSSSVPFTSLLGNNNIFPSITTLFITPGVRVKLAPSFPISPYVSAGFGYGRFNFQPGGARALAGLSSGGSTNTWAADFGGGLDLKILPHIGLRGELRDFYSGDSLQGLLPSSISSFVPFGREHNLFATGGIVVRF